MSTDETCWIVRTECGEGKEMGGCQGSVGANIPEPQEQPGLLTTFLSSIRVVQSLLGSTFLICEMGLTFSTTAKG